ncbi:unnamed protein product [Heligmosomoides polygyrus]|uniref:Acyl-CoA_dh_1 domain-containing protein n=1 Tax=Heligmosomoides polygyrus TaxID=6339 RepID=A0A183F3J0_HELPZ|nr:unnamed protein product [Heligmosomoides polygyrus]
MDHFIYGRRFAEVDEVTAVVHDFIRSKPTKFYGDITHSVHEKRKKLIGNNVNFFVKVPEKCIIGEEGRGFFYQMLQFQDERLVAAAVLLEPLQRCISLTADYARDRKIFGSTVLEQQTVQFTLAELQSELEAVRALLYRAVLSRLHGDDVTLLASMAKLKAGRLARVVTDSCLQFWGGNGFTWDNPVCRMHRDLRLHSVGAGADEVMLSIICKYMGIAPPKPRF